MIDARERGYERCIVTFIDILGYRHLLKTRHSHEIVEILEALRRFTAGDGDEAPSPTRMDEVRVYTQAFSESVSDAVVRLRTVDTQSADGPLIAELIDLTHAIIECLNHGIFIRGGLTIGPAHVGYSGKGPIFGDAMVRAFEIEQNEAVYPRIVLDEAALASYSEDNSLWQDRIFNAFEAGLAREFIAIAEDGTYFLDYLRAAGPGEFDAGVEGRFQFLKRHRDLIVEGLKNNDPNVRRKFVWLGNYHNRFVENLRATYDLNDPEGAFETEIGISPSSMFEMLVIDPTWQSHIRRIDQIAESNAEGRASRSGAVSALDTEPQSTGQSPFMT